MTLYGKRFLNFCICRRNFSIKHRPLFSGFKSADAPLVFWKMIIVHLLCAEEERSPQQPAAPELRPPKSFKRVNLVIQLESKRKLVQNYLGFTHNLLSLLPTSYHYFLLFKSNLNPEIQKCSEAPFPSYLHSQGKHGKYTNMKFLFLYEIQHFPQADKITELNCIHSIYERNCSCFHPNEADDLFFS